ncbi:MAG TPA: TonB-dependent receptor [Rhizomicrobium sp.]|nr:TonB-dependent receptor [Rhizomicrobium sp.]
MSFRSRAAILLGTTILAGTACGMAQAQTAATGSSIETVTVTAEKRTETAKNVPMSISVIGEDQLNSLNIRSFEDLIGQVPGLSVTETDPTHPTLILRGINAGGDGSTVGTYIDETPYGSSNALANGTDTAPNLDTFDMKQVEVLRGPQGTFYGAGAEGGLLRFVTNAPSTSGFDDAFQIDGMQVSNGGTGAAVRGMVNVALSDNLAVRVVGFEVRTPGYINDPALNSYGTNDLVNYGGRASILYTPTDKISIRLNVVQQQFDSDNASTEDESLFVGGKFSPLYGDYEQHRNVLEPSGVRYYLYNGTVNWDLAFATLTSATSYGILHDYTFADDTGLTGGTLNVEGFLGQQKFTQETRLTSNPGGPLDWVVGFYYTHENSTLHQDYATQFHQPLPLNIYLDSTYVEEAGFADATYHNVLGDFLPGLDLGFGGRYAHNDQSADEFGTLLAGSVYGGASTENAFTWSADAQYHLNEQVNVYVRAATGFRPGGPNDLPPGAGPTVPRTYSSDSLKDYEAGTKGELLDGALSFDADVFYISWNDIQLLTTYTVASGPGAGQYTIDANGGTARSEGAEADVAWVPFDRLNLDFNGAYTEAQLTSGTDPIYVGGVAGNALPYSPKWSATLNGEYQFLPMGDFTPYVGAAWHYIGTRYSGFTPYADVLEGLLAPNLYQNQYALPSYNTFDVRVGIDWSKWSLEVYGKNLNDAKGITAFSATGSSAASDNAPFANIIQPRLIGIVLRGKF